MDGNLTGNIREFLPFVGEGPFLGFFLVCHAASSVLPLFLPPHICPHLPPGHVQVAQVPGRGEPNSPGELNFPYLFQLLEDEGYKGFVGCEYQPRGEGGLSSRPGPGEGDLEGQVSGRGCFPPHGLRCLGSLSPQETR